MLVVTVVNEYVGGSLVGRGLSTVGSVLCLCIQPFKRSLHILAILMSGFHRKKQASIFCLSASGCVCLKCSPLQGSILKYSTFSTVMKCFASSCDFRQALFIKVGNELQGALKDQILSNSSSSASQN